MGNVLAKFITRDGAIMNRPVSHPYPANWVVQMRPKGLTWAEYLATPNKTYEIRTYRLTGFDADTGAKRIAVYEELP